ncbi:hypothetical protein HPB52_017917 [Rhipicephalus sanguineus]|uniref:PBZ-type domain-containing protein n=1 Tax=Rhipicephalus sanguineus TaxID=34632 RepID=A0A9D4T634_RHISA|nr:hypothetical protein HPB52_017917 [Rhipicephalus sanguineus]
MVLLDGSCKKLAEARIWIHTPYLIGEVTALCMSNPIYDLVLGNLPGAREPHEPDPDWEYPDWTAKVNAARRAPSSRKRSSRVSVDTRKNRDLSSPSNFSKCGQQCVARKDMVEKGAGGLANKNDDGESKSSTRSTTQRLLGSAARVTTTATSSKATNDSAMVGGGQRRQPEKRQECKYGRKGFRRNAQHLKQFSRPKVTFYEGSLGDDEARDEKEPKDHADGRNIASSQ